MKYGSTKYGISKYGRYGSISQAVALNHKFEVGKTYRIKTKDNIVYCKSVAINTANVKTVRVGNIVCTNVYISRETDIVRLKDKNGNIILYSKIVR